MRSASNPARGPRAIPLIDGPATATFVRFHRLIYGASSAMIFWAAPYSRFRVSRSGAALASSISRLFADRALRSRLAAAGHALVHERFCLDFMMRDIEAIYALAVGGDASLVPDRHGVRPADSGHVDPRPST